MKSNWQSFKNPWRSASIIQPGTLGATTAVFSRTAPQDVLMSFHSGIGPDIAMLPFKQALGEEVMDSFFNKTGEWIRLEPAHHGFDGVYVRASKSRLDVMVTEAKYNTSQLHQTKHGRQFSDTWIKHNFRKLATRLSDDRYRSLFKDAANGKIPFRARLFRYKPDGAKHIIDIVNTNTGEKQVLHGTYRELPNDIQFALRSEFQANARKMRYSAEECEHLADKWMKHPELYDKWQLRSGWSLKRGLDLRTLTTGISSALVFMISDTVFQFWQTGGIEIDRVLKMGVVGLLVGSATRITSVQSYWLLTESRVWSQTALRFGWQRATVVGVAGLTGQIVGMGIGTVVGAYAMLALGVIEVREANRFAISGGLGSLVAGGSAWLAYNLVATFGVASTGTAITSLSGVAASNATYAIFGFGTIAAGGGGVALGSVVLSGGVSVIFIVGTSGIMLYYKHLDKEELYTLLHGRLLIIEKRILDDKQQEWS